LTTTWACSRRALLLAALCGSLLLAACGPKGPAFRSTDITGADFGRELALTGHDGKPRTLADFRGRLVVLFFGYTHCPDICPTTLADMAGVMKALGKDADRVQVLFVTVDPERDTPALLAQYVAAFDPRFLALHGNLEETRKAAKEFHVVFEKHAGAASGAYTVDHSGQSYVLDAQGRLRLFVRPERVSQDLAPDLQTLLQG